MKNKYSIFVMLMILAAGCNQTYNPDVHPRKRLFRHKQPIVKESLLVDCNYTFDQAIEGSNAPEAIIKELELVTVRYYSTDNKLHQGQVLTNKKIAADIKSMFQEMLKCRFPIAKAVPIVKYNWDDDASMQDNNTYSFCYRDIEYSKHAQGTAIDINPYFNPVRWKNGYEDRTNKPVGAVYNPEKPGTFSENHPIVTEFRKRGYRWGHSFTRNFDDHHFQKKGL